MYDFYSGTTTQKGLFFLDDPSQQEAVAVQLVGVTGAGGAGVEMRVAEIVPGSSTKRRATAALFQPQAGVTLDASMCKYRAVPAAAASLGWTINVCL